MQWSHRVQWFLTCLHDYKEFNSLTDRGKLDGRGNLWEGFIPVRPLQIPWMLWCGYRKQEKVSIWRTPSLLHREFSWSFPTRHWDQNMFSKLWWPCMRCEQESEFSGCLNGNRSISTWWDHVCKCTSTMILVKDNPRKKQTLVWQKNSHSSHWFLVQYLGKRENKWCRNIHFLI